VDAVKFKRQFSDTLWELTGKWLEDGREIYVKKYNHGKISRDKVSNELWVNKDF